MIYNLYFNNMFILITVESNLVRDHFGLYNLVSLIKFILKVLFMNLIL